MGTIRNGTYLPTYMYIVLYVLKTNHVTFYNKHRWGELNIIAGYTTNHSYTDEGIAKAAGFLEGALTYK